MKYLFTIACCLLILFSACKKDNSGTNNQNNNTSWLTGTWVKYKTADTSYYPANAVPTVEVYTAAGDTFYNIINGSLKKFQLSAGTVQADTLKFMTPTTGFESYPNSDFGGNQFTYSLQTLSLTDSSDPDLPVTEYITKIAPDKIKVLTPDKYGFNEIIVRLYQKK